MNIFAPPPVTPFNFLSLGAGVQSSCLALMAATGEIEPRLDAAIFADTQAEPASVYKWLDWLEEEIARSPFPFPVHRVTRGDLSRESLTVREFKNDSSRHWVKSLIPAFILNPSGTGGIMGRQCTYSYKVEQLEKASKRLASIKRAQKEITVTQWIGISWDETQRVKNAHVKWCQHRWPLIERKMRRHDCLDWMAAHGYPTPPRSACVYCPFHSNKEWRRLKTDEPDEFSRAVQFERDLQAAKAQTDNQRGIPFLHPSRIPLDQVDLTDPDENQLQLWNTFQNECEGMCGV